MIPEADVRRDAYLSGRVEVWQPRHGYRAGMDAVLLAAACPATPGQSVLDVGCGVGTAALCLGARVADLDLWGIEREPDMATLAQRNASESRSAFTCVHGDITRPPAVLKDKVFDHAILNPPYFPRQTSSAGPTPQREVAMGEDTPLHSLIDGARKRLVPGGWLTLIHRAERLPDILSALGDRFGDVRAMPLLPRTGRPARLVVIVARKGSRSPFQILSPHVLHAAPDHTADGEDYTPETRAILRNAAALPLT